MTIEFDGQNNKITRDTAGSIKVDRKTSDGNIIELQKDGTTVGNIGVASSDLNIYGDVGIKFSGDDVRPTDSSGNNSDNAVDLGHFDVRWKDLYLGGNIYLGGTGSANALDDYEEGTFTPTLNFGTATTQLGSYVKVGNVCHIFINIADFSDITTSSNIIITLPFTSRSGDDYQSTGSVMYRYADILNGSGLSAYKADNSATLVIYQNNTTGNWSALRHDELNNALNNFRIQLTYFTA